MLSLSFLFKIIVLIANKLAVGGQAVMEGVMMRSANSFAIACRIPSGQLVIKEQRWKSIWNKYKFLRLPFLRGTVILVETLYNGLHSLTFSANMQIRYSEDEDEQEEELTKGGAALAIILSLTFAIGLFVALPHLLTSLFGLNTDTVRFHLVDGVIKLAILLLYLFAIGLLPDVKRVFMYHGAEHKSIFAYEAGEELTVENARKQSRFHPRCGTSFLFLVIGISIILFSLLLQFPLVDNKLLDNLAKVFIKIPLMLPVAGIAYELIKFSGKHSNNPLLKPIIWPGLLLQRLTTREPDDKMLETGLASLKMALWRENNLEADSFEKEVIFDSLHDIPAKPSSNPPTKDDKGSETATALV
ncbi:MAG: DUF1385 domain-containing protein [Deltaproteobacteria bacterium]|jgi:uncharacterized protein YqhQ|nr:DUF1385 domain-containing protein [Deltaproteobacteria bacterium]